MTIDSNTGLVLEGGGMRGVFTSGVLDGFMKHNLYFKYVVAVSAGACNGLSYMSHQPRRARVSNIDYMARYDYLGMRHLVTHGCILDAKLLYDKFPNQYIPYDYDTFFGSDATYEMVTTNCLTGRAEYLQEHHDRQRLTDVKLAAIRLQDCQCRRYAHARWWHSRLHTCNARHRDGPPEKRAHSDTQPWLSPFGTRP